ncbi:MAG TPA: PDZ domain-containing protein [Phycisphaerae bacterium]|nr:PDZ domain-containing protein [Phycisphaerae bacterium]HUT57785.1 PDZ domain-containing protein [Phycisphaerae bacterium]
MVSESGKQAVFAAALLAATLAAQAGPPPKTPPPSTQPSQGELDSQAKELAEEYLKLLGDGYSTKSDAKRHLVYVSALDERTLRSVMSLLAAHGDAQRRMLFPSPLQSNVVVILPTVADYRRLVSNPKALGQYDRRKRALVSISLSSILLHEFTHALHHNDQLRAGQTHAVWVAEGIAMLFQHAKLADGNLAPLPDWSLQPLQEAIRDKKVVALSQLMKMGRKQFTDRAEVCYPQVRWLMMYLHQSGKLKSFYETYKASYDQDRTGAMALEKTLGRPLKRIEAEWRSWVLARKPPWRPANLPHAHLGIRMQPAEGGVRIDGFLRGSAARRTGFLKVGDIIISVAGRPTPAPGDLTEAVQACRPGQTVDIEVIRNGRTALIKQLLGAVRAQDK